MASSWILFFSYQDDARSNTHKKIRPINIKLQIFELVPCCGTYCVRRCVKVFTTSLCLNKK